MTVYRLNPVLDPRWAGLVERHPDASVFHTPGWLAALQRTYGFEPVAFTTSPPGQQLGNGIAFCEIRSWLTGRRLVSLPFSDHCDPLVEEAGQFVAICDWLEAERRKSGVRYIELRPHRTGLPVRPALSASAQYSLHVLDLRPDLDQLFGSFHHASTQRKIRRAERDGLAVEEGHSEQLLRTFYRLLLLTRRRHGLPPQPFEWFCNLVACLEPMVTVRIASRDGQPVAGLMTLRHRNTTVYKYGASDAAFHHFGGMQFLFWKTIQAARAEGCVGLDLGRSDLDQPGLIAFKDRLGATRTAITYWRYPAPPVAENQLRTYLTSQARHAFGHMPDRYRIAAGRFLYRHVG